MKINLPKPKNIIKKMIKLTEIMPHKHWGFLVHLSILISIGLIIFSFYLLIQIKKDNLFQVEIKPKENPVLLKEKLILETKNFFEQKNIKFNEIKNNPYPFSDPSL